MANKSSIDELVSEKAHKQIEQLIADLGIAKNEMGQLIVEAIKMNNVIGGAKTFKELQTGVERAVKAINKIPEATEKTRLAELKLQQVREKAMDKYYAGLQKIDQASIKQLARTTEQSRAFNVLAKSLANAEKEALDIGATFGASSPQYVKAAKGVQELRAQVDKLEQPLGKFQRNVGNYEGGFRNLTSSIGQLTRELPNAGISLQTFILSLSNQYGALYDSIQQVNQQNKELVANGQKPVSVFKQIGLAVFSLQTLIAIGITFFIAYREEIGNFFSALSKGGNELSEAKARIEALNKTAESTDFSSAIESVIELKTNIKLAKDGFIDKEKVLTQYNTTIGQTIGEARSLNEAEALLVAKGNAFIQMTLQKAIAQAAASEAAKKAVQAAVELNKSDEETGSYIFSGLKGKKGYDKIYKREAAANRQSAAEAFTKEQDVFTKIFVDAQTKAAKIAKDNKFDIFGGDYEKKGKKKDDTTASDLLQLAELRLRIQAETSKKIAENELYSFDVRNSALENFLKVSEELEKNSQQQQLLEEDLTKAKKQSIALDTQNKINNIQKDGGLIRAKIIKDQLTLEDQVRVEAAQKTLNIIETSRDSELLALQFKFQAGEISEKEYSEERLRLHRQFTQDYIVQEIKGVEALIDVNKKRGIDTSEQEKQLAALKLKLSSETTNKQIEDLKTLAEAEREIADKRKELSNEVFELGQVLVEGQFQKEQERNDAALEAIDKREEKEKRALDFQILSQDQKAIKIAQIELKAQVDREQVEKRQRVLDINRAKFEKAADILKIIGSTAAAVMKYGAITPAALLTAAIGAAQIAKVIATPLPKFWTGTENSPEGHAWVGERGTELRIDPDGKYSLTPDKPTLTYLEKGTVIKSNPELKRMLAKPEQIQYVGGQSIDISKLVEATAKSTSRLEKAFSSRPENKTTITKGGIKYMFRNGNSWSSYHNRI